MIDRKNNLIVLLLLCVPHILSCAATQKINFPEQKEKTNLRGKRVVISNFLVSSNMTLKSYEGRTYRGKDVYDEYSYKTKRDLHDVSNLLARYLNRHGIRARSVKILRFNQVGKNEVVITGAAAITAKDAITPLNVGCLLIMVGAILPNPLGFSCGADAKYTYVIMDSQRKIIYNRDIQKGKVYYKWYWIWPSLDEYSRRYKMARPIAVEEVFKDVVKTLK